MKILTIFLVLFLVFKTSSRAQRVDQRNLCIACGITANRIVSAIRENQELRYDIHDLRQHVLKKAPAGQHLKINTIFSGWTIVLEEMLQSDEQLTIQSLNQKLCQQNNICETKEL